MKQKIVKRIKAKTLGEFKSIFNTSKRKKSFDDVVLGLKPGRDILMVRVPVDSLTNEPNWNSVKLPYTKAKKMGLTVRTRRYYSRRNTHAIYVGIFK